MSVPANSWNFEIEKYRPETYVSGRYFNIQTLFQLAPPLVSMISMPWAFSSSRMRSASAKFFAFFASYRASTSASMAGSPSPVTV